MVEQILEILSARRPKMVDIADSLESLEALSVLFKKKNVVIETAANLPWKSSMSCYGIKKFPPSGEMLGGLLRLKRENALLSLAFLLEDNFWKWNGVDANPEEYETVVLQGCWLAEAAIGGYCKDRTENCDLYSGEVRGQQHGVTVVIDCTYYFRKKAEQGAMSGH